MSVFEYVSRICKQSLENLESFPGVEIDVDATLLIVEILPIHRVRAEVYSRMPRLSLIRHTAYTLPFYATRRIPLPGTLTEDASPATQGG
jgi:hypothetical protein